MKKNHKIRFLKNKDGSEYTGGLKHELPSGFGILRDSNSNEFKCEWSNGQIDGMAYICYKDRRQFLGSFIKGKKYGLGALSYNGKIYLGEFQESKRTGYGEVLEIALSQNSSRLGQKMNKRKCLDSDPRLFDMARNSKVIKEPLEILAEVMEKNSDDEDEELENSKIITHRLLEFNFEKPGIIIHSKRGYFLNGRLKGYGEFMIPQNDYYYFGTFKDGNFEGSGVEKTSEDIYHGRFMNGLREGIGISESKLDKIEFQGNWVKGMKEGFGILDQAGIKYEGFFKRSKKHGYARMTKPSKNYLFIGKFQRGSKSDFGRLEKNSNVYLGGYERGKKNGFGYYKNVGKYTYIGEWKEGKKDGFGYEVTEFDEFKGEFFLGERHGKGVLKFKGKSPFSCVYHNGELRERSNENLSRILNMFTKEKIDHYFNTSKERLDRIESIINNSKANLISELSVVRRNFKEESEILDDRIRYFKKEFKGLVTGFRQLYGQFEENCLKQSPSSARIISGRAGEEGVDSFDWEPMKFTPSRITKSQLLKRELSKNEFLNLEKLRKKSSKNLHQFMRFDGKGIKSPSPTPKKKKRRKKSKKKRGKSKRRKRSMTSRSRSGSNSASRSCSDISRKENSEMKQNVQNSYQAGKGKFDTFYDEKKHQPKIMTAGYINKENVETLAKSKKEVVNTKNIYKRRTSSKFKGDRIDRTTERKPSFVQEANVGGQLSPIISQGKIVERKCTTSYKKETYELKTPKVKREFQSPKNKVCSTQKRKYEIFSQKKKSRVEQIFEKRQKKTLNAVITVSQELSPLQEKKLDYNRPLLKKNLKNEKNPKKISPPASPKPSKQDKFMSPITQKSIYTNSNFSVLKNSPEASEFIMNYSSRNNYGSITNQLKIKKKFMTLETTRETEIKFFADFFLQIEGYDLINYISDYIIAAGENGIAVFLKTSKKKLEFRFDQKALYTFQNKCKFSAMKRWFNRDLIVCFESLSQMLYLFDFKLELIKTIKTEKNPKNVDEEVDLEIVGNIAIISSNSSLKLVDLNTKKFKKIHGFYDMKESETTPIALITDLKSQKLMGYSKSSATSNTYTHFLEDRKGVFKVKKIKDLSDRFSLCHKVKCARKLNSEFILLGGASYFGNGLERPFLLLATFDSTHVPISGSIIDDLENSTSIESLEILKLKNSKKKFKILGVGIGWIFVYIVENNNIFDVGRIKLDSSLTPSSHFMKGEFFYLKYPGSNVVSVFKIGLDSRYGEDVESYRDFGNNYEIDELFLNSQNVLEERFVVLSEENKLHQFSENDMDNLELFDLRIQNRDFSKEFEFLRNRIKGFDFKNSKNLFQSISKNEIHSLICLEVLNDGRLLKVIGGRKNSIQIGSYHLPLGIENPIVYVEYNKKFDLVYFLCEEGNLGVISIKDNLIKIVENFEPYVTGKKVVGMTSDESCDKIFVIFDPKANTGRSCDLVVYDKQEGIFKHRFLHLLDDGYDCEIDFYQEKVFVVGKKQNFSVLVCFNFDKELLFISDFMRLNDEFRSVERIPGTNTLILGAQNSIYFVNFFEGSFKKLLKYSILPHLIQEVFISDFEIYCKMKEKEDKLSVIRFPFSRMTVSKNELLKRERRVGKNHENFEGLKISEFKRNLTNRSSDSKIKKKRAQGKLDEYIKLSMEGTEHSFNNKSKLLETKDLITDFPFSPKARKKEETYDNTDNNMTYDIGNTSRENIAIQSIETNILLNTYVPSNWNTLGQVSLKRKSSEDINDLKPGPVNARLVHPSVSTFEFQYSPNGKDMVTSERSKRKIEYINSMRLSALKPNDDTGLKEKMWFKEFFVESYKGNFKKEFIKIEISGNGRLVYLLSRDLELYAIDLEKSENLEDNQERGWDLNCEKISTLKIYNFTCVSEDLCLAYCVKHSTVRIFKAMKLVNVFDSTCYFQSQKKYGSFCSTDIPILEDLHNLNKGVSRVFYTPSKGVFSSKANSQYVDLIPEGSEERIDQAASDLSRFNTPYMGKEGGILWLESNYGVRFTNFNERDQALQPGQLLKLWKVQVPIPPKGDDLAFRFVLDISNISKIIGLAVSRKTRRQYLQILDTLHFSPKTVILDDIERLEDCTFFNAIHVNSLAGETMLVMCGSRLDGEDRKGVLASFSLKNHYMQEEGKKSEIFVDSELELLDVMNFNEYRNLNNIKNFEENEFFICAEWDILLFEINNSGRCNVMTVVSDISKGIVFDVFMFLDCLYAVCEGEDTELFKRINFVGLKG